MDHGVDGLVVEEDAVLDRPHARRDRVLDALGALGMSEHGTADGGRLRDRRAQLVAVELGMPRIVGRGQHPAGGAHLDDVRAGTQHLSDDAAHLVGAVGDAARPTGVRQRYGDVDTRGQPSVAVATGLADNAHADQHAWAPHQPVRLRFAQAGVGAARVAHRRDARREGVAHVSGRSEELVAKRLAQAAHHVDARGGQVNVAIEEPRQHRTAGNVNGDVTVQVGADVDDPPAGDGNVAAPRVATCPVKHRSTPQDGARRAHVWTAPRASERIASSACNKAPIGSTSSSNTARGL